MVSKKEGLLRFIAHLSRAAILGYQKFGDEPGLLVIVLVNVGECHVCGVVQNEHGLSCTHIVTTCSISRWLQELRLA